MVNITQESQEIDPINKEENVLDIFTVIQGLDERRKLKLTSEEKKNYFNQYGVLIHDFGKFEFRKISENKI